ncbi:MAG: SelB C-terminal domain-containing protein [Candidatus Aminicenantes bacterium]|nr:MAG: SelB C-terminal domain-containing protein [Candidatus Aminicenantes bacterium]
MKFNAYIVELKHRENSLTGSLITSDQIVSANFRKIGKDIFIANFKTQVEFKFLEKVVFKKRDKEILVLLPMISKYNKRKLTKISKFLSNGTPGKREKTTILLNLLTVEKFLKAQELLSFFTIHREELIDFLIQKEIHKKIKIIDFIHLSITTYESAQNYHKMLRGILTDCYTNRAKTIKLSEIESKLKLPRSSLFFKYLLQCARNNFSFKVLTDKIVFQKMALSENEKDSLLEIETTLKKHKISIFSIENILNLSDLVQKEVNDSLWLLIERGQVVQLNEKYFIFKDELNKILNKLKKYKRNQGELIDIQAFRELTLLTRRYIIVLFEYFDTRGITRRVANQRKILLPV